MSPSVNRVCIIRAVTPLCPRRSGATCNRSNFLESRRPRYDSPICRIDHARLQSQGTGYGTSTRQDGVHKLHLVITVCKNATTLHVLSARDVARHAYSAVVQLYTRS